MLRSVALFLAFLALAGCDKSATPLNLPPDFYPSALAVDARHHRYLVGSFHNAEVAVLDRRGRRLGTVRAPTPGERVLRMAVQGRTLWVALSGAVEAIDLDRPQQPRRVYRLRTAARFADMALHGERVFLLDAQQRSVYVLDAARGVAHRLTTLPQSETASRPAACPLTDQYAEAGGALLSTPKGEVLLVVLDGALYRLHIATARVDPVPLRQPLTHVTHLLYRGMRDGRHEILAVRGAASRVTHVRLDGAFRHAHYEESFRVSSAAPVAAAWDGAALRMVYGSLRHHPYYCGDGRPSAAIRMVRYGPQEKERSLALADSLAR